MTAKTDIENTEDSSALSVESTNLFVIPGCHDCPFYEAKYCILGGWLSAIDGIARNNYRVNEWRAEVMPESCPLKERAITSFVPNSKLTGTHSDVRSSDSTQ